MSTRLHRRARRLRQPFSLFSVPRHIHACRPHTRHTSMRISKFYSLRTRKIHLGQWYKNGVTFISLRFGSYMVLRLHMMHRFARRTLLPVPPDAGLRLLRPALESAVIVLVQASLVIRDLTLRVFVITRFREKKPWENCRVILQSPCTVVAWLCGARTSWSHLTSISVTGSVELASPVDVERSSFIFKAMEKKK